jgi:hypothetical protein
MVGRPQHTDHELLELAREGSAPAFASLLHRHRDVLQRGALRAEHPEAMVATVMVGAIRRLRRGTIADDGIRTWLSASVDEEVARAPGRPGIERLLPAEWFDRAWVRAQRSWPSGRRVPRPPRLVGQLGVTLAIAALGAGGAYVAITAETTTEVIHELIAEPVEDPDVVAVPGPVVDTPPEQAPELFGDVDIGELPTYDLTGEGARGATEGPTLAPPGRDGPATSP